MKSYFATAETKGSAENALGRMIEYAKFLENETGRGGSGSFVDTIINECNIQVTTEEC